MNKLETNKTKQKHSKDRLIWIQLKACAQNLHLDELGLDQLQHCEPTVAATSLLFDPPEKQFNPPIFQLSHLLHKQVQNPSQNMTNDLREDNCWMFRLVASQGDSFRVQHKP